MFNDIPLFLKDFLNYLETIKGLSPRTIKEYYYDLRSFLTFIQEDRGKLLDHTDPKSPSIQEIQAEDLGDLKINDLLAFLADSPTGSVKSASRRARETSSLRSLYNYLVDIEEAFENNPASKLSTPKKGQRHPVYLTLDEAIHLIKTASNQDNKFFRYRDVAILVTFLTTGIRLSELVSMNVQSVKRDAFTVIGKGNKERTVYMTDSCREAIKLYLEVRPDLEDEDALFLSSRKQRISTRAVQHRIALMLKRAGFDSSVYSTHKLRHTAATLMYKEGVDIRTLQKILGHASVATTQIYTHLDDDLVRQAVNQNPLAKLDLGANTKSEEGPDQAKPGKDKQ